VRASGSSRSQRAVEAARNSRDRVRCSATEALLRSLARGVESSADHSP
jgi:hypothetical protein